MNNEEDTIFGLDIVKAYDLELEEAYNFIKQNTKYLDNVSLEDVKEIRISYYKDIFVLLKDGNLYTNGKKMLSNINTMAFGGGATFYAFSNDRIITCITGVWKTTDYINNNDYKYKKIIVTPIKVVALTWDNEIKFIGMLVDEIINHELYTGIDDIGYNLEYDEIIVKKDGKILSLFSNEEYENERFVEYSGSGEDYIIL